MKLIILFFLCALPLYSETRYEISPVQDKQAQGEIEYRNNIKLILADGRVVSGEYSYRAPETILLKHTKGGIAYEKKIKMQQIASIEILTWKGKQIKSNQEGIIYQFDPTSYLITLKDKIQITKEGDIFPFFKTIKLENANGSTTLFTFWLDLQKNDGSWFTGLTGNLIRDKGHQDCIKKIEFD